MARMTAEVLVLRHAPHREGGRRLGMTAAGFKKRLEAALMREIKENANAE